MISFEINNNIINGVQIDEYCKQHCKSCIHNCVCDNKNKEGLITYFEGLKVSKNNSALFDNVEFVCPYHKEEEKSSYSDFDKMYQQVLNNISKKNEIQRLKELIDCEYKNDENGSSNNNNKLNEIQIGNYKTLGKRLLFYIIQLQINVIDKETITKKELIDLMLTFEDMLYKDEQLFGIAYETGVDRTITEASKNLSKEWKNEIREECK